MAFQTTLIALAIMMISLRATAMTILPQCDDFRDEMRTRRVTLFVEGEGDHPLLEEHKCFAPEGVVSYYACKPGYEAVLKNIDDLEILSDLGIIFDINQLRSVPGNDREENVVDCLPEEAEEIQNEEESQETKVEEETQDEKETENKETEEESISDSKATTSASSASADSASTTAAVRTSTQQDQVSSTQASSTGSSSVASTTNQQAKTTPPPLPMCSEVSGISRRTSFRPEARPRVCDFRCRFAVSVYGLHAGFRTRRLYKCCEGEAQRISTGIYATYTCPQ